MKKIKGAGDQILKKRNFGLVEISGRIKISCSFDSHCFFIFNLKQKQKSYRPLKSTNFYFWGNGIAPFEMNHPIRKTLFGMRGMFGQESVLI